MTRASVRCTQRTPAARWLGPLALGHGWRAWLAAAVRQRLQRRTLDRLSDHMLRDLGLERAEEPRTATDWLSRR